MKLSMECRSVIVGALAFALATSAATAQTYLLSISGISLAPDESVRSFTVKTWGVEIEAICHIPGDWEITGGRFGPLGRIAGQAGHGATALRTRDLRQLRGLALIELSGSISPYGHGSVPATFGGELSVDFGRSNSTGTVPITKANIQLVKADACPSRR